MKPNILVRRYTRQHAPTRSCMLRVSDKGAFAHLENGYIPETMGGRGGREDKVGRKQDQTATSCTVDAGVVAHKAECYMRHGGNPGPHKLIWAVRSPNSTSCRAVCGFMRGDTNQM